MIDAVDCNGCRDDFYNGKNPLGVQKCWLRDKAQMVIKYRIHRDTLPATKGAYTEVLVPNCYHQQGYVFDGKLPDFVKRENVVRRRA